MALPAIVADDQLIVLLIGDHFYAYSPEQRDSAEEAHTVAEAALAMTSIGTIPAANWEKVQEVMAEYVPNIEIHDMRPQTGE